MPDPTTGPMTVKVEGSRFEPVEFEAVQMTKLYGVEGYDMPGSPYMHARHTGDNLWIFIEGHLTTKAGYVIAEAERAWHQDPSNRRLA